MLVLLSIGDGPSGEVNRLWRGVQQRNGFGLRCSADGVWQSCNNADDAIQRRLLDGCNTVSCDIIGVPTLRLELEENRCPSLHHWKMDKECSILPDAILWNEPLCIALIHVNVMYAVARTKAEDLIPLGLWPPAFAKSINQRLLVCQRWLHVGIKQLVQIIILTRLVEW